MERYISRRESIQQDLYHHFIDINYPLKTYHFPSLEKDWDNMLALYLDASERQYIPGQFNSMLDALNMYARMLGDTISKESKRRALFLGDNLPRVVHKLLSQNTDEALAQACCLTDKFSFLTISRSPNARKSIMLQLACAKAARSNPVVAFWQGSRAAHGIAILLKSDNRKGPVKRPDLKLQKKTIKFLRLFAETQEARKANVHNDAADVAAFCEQLLQPNPVRPPSNARRSTSSEKRPPVFNS